MSRKKIKENPKAVAARERKAQTELEKKLAEAKMAEDAKWADEGSTRKEQRARERQEREQQKLEARQRKKAAVEEDETMMASVKLSSKARRELKQHGEAVPKVTQHDLLTRREREDQERKELEKQKNLQDQKILTTDYSNFENTNRQRNQTLEDDEAVYGKGNVLHASSIDSAIKGLSILDVTADDLKVDRFPEKRRKAAYKQFYNQRLPELRLDQPDLKLSQYKEIIFKEWQKSPENPVNQS